MANYLANVGAAVLRPLTRRLRVAARVITGRPLLVRTHFRDFSIYGGIFEARAEAVRPRLPSGFEPIETRPGWTMITIAAFDFRRVDMFSPYRQVAITTPVRFQPFEGAAHDGDLILQLPTTTEQSRWAGLYYYGFPETLAEVELDTQDGGCACTLRQHGQHVLTLGVDARATAQASLRYTNLSLRRGGEVIESRFDLEGVVGEASEPGGVTLALGYHAIADQLRALGIEPDSGRGFYAPRVHAVMSPPVELGQLPEPRVERGVEEGPSAPPPMPPATA